ncbi:MAG: hypothetical protein AAB426_12940, partial [Myxococcota bacterium]
AEVLADIGPTIKADFPDVKFFGSENMLAMEGGADRQWFYAQAIHDSAAATAQLDALAVHGYSDGVLPTPSSATAQLWTTLRSDYAVPMNKPVWMTETSGFNEIWAEGPMELAKAIYAALSFGNLSLWVWWQGSNLDGINNYSLMQGSAVHGKKYYVSKSYYRYIRPGARRVSAVATDPELLTLAFEHPTMGAFTVVIINAGAAPKDVNLLGDGLPATFAAYRTSASEDTAELGSLGPSFSVPARSITTLVDGNVYEHLAPPVDSGDPPDPDPDGGNLAGPSVTTSSCACREAGASSFAWLLLLYLSVAMRSRRSA